jgi:xylulokinase
MEKKYVIGTDIGTQSIRVQVFDENLKIVSKAVTEQYVETLKPLWATQKASFWWEAVKNNIKKAMTDAGVTGDDIAAFGCCAHMHGAVPVKFDGTVVDDDIQLYSDKRGSAIAEKMKEELTDENYDLSANVPIPSWHGIKIRWIKENLPDVYEKADKFLTPKDFINFKLTGRACIDPSEASGTFAMNRHTDQWSDELVKQLGIDREKLPEIKKAYEIIGNVSAEAAKETGLSKNTVVIAGGGDMLSLLYISGMHKLGTVVDITGTGGVICGYTENPIMDKRIMNLRHVLEGWVPFGNIDSAGGAFRWLRDVLCKQEASYARSIGKDDYAYLCELAEKVPAGADGLYFLPYLMGERTMGSADSRACFIGLSLEKQIGHFIRALLEGVALEFKRTLDIFDSSGTPVQRVFHSGGGAKGDLWNQIKADIYQKPIYTLEADEGGVLGVALMAAVAVGIVDDLVEGAERLLKVKKIYEPNPDNKAVYEDMYAVFTKLHDVLQEPFKHMADVLKKYQ